MLRDAGDLISPAVAETISEIALTGADAAAVKLARRYAALIDASIDDPKLYAWSLRWIGPHLLATLESLGATPQARSRLKGGLAPDVPTRLHALRAARP